MWLVDALQKNGEGRESQPYEYNYATVVGHSSDCAGRDRKFDSMPQELDGVQPINGAEIKERPFLCQETPRNA